MERSEALRRLGERASDQWGLVTAAQAKLDGLQGVDLLRLERAGLLEAVGRGVYRIAAAVVPEHLEIKVAWLRLDPKTSAWQRKAGDRRSGVISHASACELHGLGDIPADRVELIVPVRRTTRDEGIALHQLPLETEDITVVDGLPVTTAERTIADLLRSKADGAHIGTVIADADLKGMLDLERLTARITPFARAYGLRATASGEDLVIALCEQAGRTLHSQQTEQAAAAGFASALTALETLASQPAVLDQLLKVRNHPQPALTALASHTTAWQDVMAKAAGQSAWQEVMAKIARSGTAWQDAMAKAAGQNAWQEVMAKIARSGTAWQDAMAKAAGQNAWQEVI
ncbi:type IV toxin-antitoxin system AbiEi family antitoxin domain-containing protein, partial [Streptomyces sp. NPDC003395]